jgi:hypothetical protein
MQNEGRVLAGKPKGHHTVLHSRRRTLHGKEYEWK